MTYFTIILNLYFYIDLVEKVVIFLKYFLWFFCTIFKINFFHTAVDKLFDEKISKNLDEAIFKLYLSNYFFHFWPPLHVDRRLLILIKYLDFHDILKKYLRSCMNFILSCEANWNIIYQIRSLKKFIIYKDGHFAIKTTS